MENKSAINSFLAEIKEAEGSDFVCNEEALIMHQKTLDANPIGLGIKILSIFGGIMASLAFIGFLFLTGAYDSPTFMIILGVLAVSTSLFINRRLTTLLIDTFGISLYGIGFILMAIGLSELHVGESVICLIFIGIGLLTLFITQKYVLSFVVTLLINGSLLSLFMINDWYWALSMYMAILILGVTYWMMNEAQLLTANQRLLQLYNPVRIALIFCLILGLIMGDKGFWSPFSRLNNLIVMITVAVALFYMIKQLMPLLGVSQKSQQAVIYGCVLIILAATYQTPSIGCSLLLLLMSFYVNYKTGFAISIIAFIYFIILYYYDLNLSLLHKSLILMGTGAVFIFLYVLTLKNNRDEKL